MNTAFSFIFSGGAVENKVEEGVIFMVSERLEAPLGAGVAGSDVSRIPTLWVRRR